MKRSESSLELTVKQMHKESRGLPFEVEGAWECTCYYMALYMDEHADNGAGLNIKKSALMAAGRLYWLLRETRPTLSGLFSEGDILTLLNCHQGNMFYPERMDKIESDLCDEFGVALDDAYEPTLGQLIEKLRSLNALQRMTLADALEQTWYRGIGLEKKQAKDFLKTLGIYLN
ncbi:hypothetical protein [Massilia phyllosphaerae]|uniref:hypothetical protein n=1 Tax=Massilia phyllosphaerae TaxID=3106034 RepID=UPI002B1CC6D2|nr:hypothetical protein [Massilia sp. SGZ-792]